MSIRDRLRARSLPSETVVFPADPGAYSVALQGLQVVEAQLVEARRRGAGVADAEAAVVAAEATLDSLESFKFEVRALPPAEWEALVAQHPAGKDADHGWDFDPPTFFPALLEACVTDQDAAEDDEPLTAAVWVELFAQGQMNLAEKNTLINTALGLNTRTIGVQVGKGSAQTPS